MLKDLIRLANHLDQRGLRKEADHLDLIIRKMAQESVDIDDDEVYLDGRLVNEDSLFDWYDKDRDEDHDLGPHGERDDHILLTMPDEGDGPECIDRTRSPGAPMTLEEFREEERRLARGLPPAR